MLSSRKLKEDVVDLYRVLRSSKIKCYLKFAIEILPRRNRSIGKKFALSPKMNLSPKLSEPVPKGGEGKYPTPNENIL